jgi:predicted ATPase/DNA-binding NarL/FixJ family response regulator
MLGRGLPPVMEGGRVSSAGLVGNLPAPVDRFVGRDREVTELLSRLEHARLVSVVGPGGAGKTRLALEAARRAGPRYPDGVWLVELGTATRPPLVAQLLAEALGAAERPDEDLLSTVVERLAGGTALVVIDNCEHLLDACAVLVQTLLRRCPEVRVIATSREALRISGESVVPLGGLSVGQDAVELFLDRARQWGRAVMLGPAEVPVVEEVCARLDGLPLAIELATRRLGLLGLEGLRDRLDDRLSVLTVGSRTAEPRQASLRGAIDWSYDLADKRDQTVLRRLSVFPGTFDLDGAVAVCADDTLSAGYVVESVGTLIECSLLAQVPGADSEAGQRFRQLETIRVYGLDRLVDAGELEPTRERFLGYLAGLVDTVMRRHLRTGRDTAFTREWQNLSHAVELAIAADDPRQVALAAAFAMSWRSRGFVAESGYLLTTVLRFPGARDEHRSAALSELAWLRINHEEYALAAPLLEESLAIERARQDPLDLAEALAMIALCREYTGDVPAAVAYLREALAIAESLDDAQLTALHRHDLARILVQADELTEATAVLEQVVAGCRTDGPVWLLVSALHSLGDTALVRDDLGTAHACFTEALTRDRDDPVNLAYNLEGVAIVLSRRSESEPAVRLAAAAAAIRERLRSTAEPSWRQRFDAALDTARRALGPVRASAAESAGRALGSPAAVAEALGETAPEPEADTALTRREEEVAVLVAKGFTNRQIATRLGIGERTVESHLEHIRRKLALASRVQVALWAANR